MKSPFPGMDPYLEEHWGDIHARLVVYACDLIQATLPSDLRARVQERVFVESSEAGTRTVYPDVRVVETRTPQGNGGTAVAVVDEPLILHLDDDEPLTEGFIEIVAAGTGHRVVTVIEMISLANKTRGPGQDLYRQKQDEVRAAGASLVEIDLLRAGQRVASVPEQKIPKDYRTPYRVCVRRGWQPKKAEIYRLPLRQKLPVVGIPLREKDADASLDLQAILDQCYRNGGYDDTDYRAPPNPPLDADDARWADELLRAAGRR